jgi:hypothetical protein
LKPSLLKWRHGRHFRDHTSFIRSGPPPSPLREKPVTSFTKLRGLSRVLPGCPDPGNMPRKSTGSDSVISAIGTFGYLTKFFFDKHFNHHPVMT